MRNWIPALKSLVMQVSQQAILPHFSSSVNHEFKADGSPVTLADKAADNMIRQALAQLTPSIPILSEETADQVDNQQRLSWSRLWLVDPLDGTRQFIRGDTGFSINIALVEHHRPVLGVVYSPVDQLGYWAVSGEGAWRWQGDGVDEAIHVQAMQQPVRVITGYSNHQPRGKKMQAFLASLPSYTLLHMGSAIKICKIAEGSVDVYPRFGLTSEWDTAAGQVIVEQAGGALLDEQGQPLTYNQRLSINNPPFIVWGQP
jgi:3'(2'), 5'-bisphosphate nucleotidase